MVLAEPIKLARELTKDMIGDLFMTREGKVVCLEEWKVGTHLPYFKDTTASFTDKIQRAVSGVYWVTGGDPKDIVKHLTRSKYPEYYL